MDIEERTAIYVDALVDAYTQMRRRYRPDYKGHVGAENRCRVHRIAQLIMKEELDPYAFMLFAFDRCAVHSDDVYIPMVFSEQAVDLYRQAHHADLVDNDRMAELKLLLRLQSDTIIRRLWRGDTLQEILTDDLEGLSAVFRFASAWGFGERELAERFRSDAKRMLMFDPCYRKLLKGLLPEDMLHV